MNPNEFVVRSLQPSNPAKAIASLDEALHKLASVQSSDSPDRWPPNDRTLHRAFSVAREMWQRQLAAAAAA